MLSRDQAHRSNKSEFLPKICNIVGMNKDDVIARLKAHQPEFEALGVQHLCLFGSFARGEGDRESDVDLVATFDPAARPGLKVVTVHRRLEEILDRSVGLIRSPVVLELQQTIDREGVYAF